MPNHVKNRIEILGSDEEVQMVIDSIRGEPYEDGSERTVDFNKILPMPESLHVNIHSGIEDAVKNALAMPAHSNRLIAMLEMSNRSQAVSPLKFTDEEWGMFIQCLQNVRKHGHMFWYDWACKNWGTKWNAYSQERVSANTVVFETAWSSVVGLIEKLSKKFPSVRFFYQYADEDTGSNCGEGYVQNGASKINCPKSGSVEAYELAFKLRPNHKNNYVLVNGKYEYREEDKDRTSCAPEPAPEAKECATAGIFDDCR